MPLTIRIHRGFTSQYGLRRHVARRAFIVGFGRLPGTKIGLPDQLRVHSSVWDDECVRRQHLVHARSANDARSRNRARSSRAELFGGGVVSIFLTAPRSTHKWPTSLSSFPLRDRLSMERRSSASFSRKRDL